MRLHVTTISSPMTRSAPRTLKLQRAADRAPRHSFERLVGPPGIRGLTRPWQTGQAQLRRSAMFIATVQSNDRSKPHRGGMDCPTQPRAAPPGLGNILMDIVGYRYVTLMGFGIFRCTLRRPTTQLRHSRPLA